MCTGSDLEMVPHLLNAIPNKIPCIAAFTMMLHREVLWGHSDLPPQLQTTNYPKGTDMCLLRPLQRSKRRETKERNPLTWISVLHMVKDITGFGFVLICLSSTFFWGPPLLSRGFSFRWHLRKWLSRFCFLCQHILRMKKATAHWLQKLGTESPGHQPVSSLSVYQKTFPMSSARGW